MNLENILEEIGKKTNTDFLKKDQDEFIFYPNHKWDYNFYDFVKLAKEAIYETNGISLGANAFQIGPIGFIENNSISFVVRCERVFFITFIIQKNESNNLKSYIANFGSIKKDDILLIGNRPCTVISTHELQKENKVQVSIDNNRFYLVKQGNETVNFLQNY